MKVHSLMIQGRRTRRNKEQWERKLAYYPIQLNVEGKNVVVIGGGKVAERFITIT
ncbi:hypothetical protein ACJROX_08475 [Pseudalkalibacillus sp. A8]|uniref:hypothetical protein n=1 Tax=Pseudalkalibacillus sp. A8 TaxID=3382641 RepID=UPI0038B49399